MPRQLLFAAAAAGAAGITVGATALVLHASRPWFAAYAATVTALAIAAIALGAQ